MNKEEEEEERKINKGNNQTKLGKRTRPLNKQNEEPPKPPTYLTT